MEEGDNIVKRGLDRGFSDVISSAGKDDWAYCFMDVSGTFYSLCLFDFDQTDTARPVDGLPMPSLHLAVDSCPRSIWWKWMMWMENSNEGESRHLDGGSPKKKKVSLSKIKLIRFFPGLFCQSVSSGVEINQYLSNETKTEWCCKIRS